MANFSIDEFKPDNVYQKIHAMQAEPSSHASDIFYLFVDADVNWGSGLNREPKHIYTIVIQYSATLGHNPDLQQPAHILEEDALEVSGKYHLFIRERKEYWEIQKALKV